MLPLSLPAEFTTDDTPPQYYTPYGTNVGRLPETPGVAQVICYNMVQDDPAKRPTIGEAIGRFTEIRKTLSWWKLRSRLQKDTYLSDDEGGSLKTMEHVLRTVGYLTTFRSAVPLP